MARTATKAKVSKVKKVEVKAKKTKKKSTAKTAVQQEKEQIKKLLKLAEQQQQEEQRTYHYERHIIQFKPLIFEKEGQITASEMRKMSLTERMKLWKNLNKGEETRFIPILKHGEAGQKAMPFEEAEVRGLLSKKTKGALYCPYCYDWSHFQKFNYYDSHKCISCGISVNDFYVKTYNNLWEKK